MQKKMRGVVIYATKISDQKKIVEIFTDVTGCVSFVVHIASGRRGGGNNILYQPLSLVDFVTDLKPGVNLHYLRDVQLSVPFLSIPFNVYKTTIAVFLAEFLHRALRIEYEDKPLFDFLTNSIQWFDETKDSVANFHLTFMIQISRFLGIYPNAEGYKRGYFFDLMNGCFCRQIPMHTFYLKPDEAKWVRYFMCMRYTNMNKFHLTRDQRMQCLNVIIDYYRLHIPGFPLLKSLDILKGLFD